MQECASIRFIRLYVELQPAGLGQPASGLIGPSRAAFGWRACGCEQKRCCLQSTNSQTGRTGLKASERAGILQTRAKTICGGEQGSTQRSLYLMSLEQTASSTRGGRTDGWKICLQLVFRLCESTRRGAEACSSLLKSPRLTEKTDLVMDSVCHLTS